MAFSLGVWADRAVPGGTLYRWESDQGHGGAGFVIFNAEAKTIRPSNAEGSVVGSLVVDGEAGETTGTSEGVDRPNFMRVAASILKAGEAPATAHTYYG
jgi:hypothetical protein